LNGPITSAEKLLLTDQKIICSQSTEVRKLTGFIKFGTKKLFFYKRNGAIVEIADALCLLDFYVDEAQQRKGLGLQLFQEFLRLSNVNPEFVAYDRPSTKLIAFMRKHFNLCKPDFQPNRFALFEGFPLI